MFDWLYGPILKTKADRLGTYAAAMAYCLVLSLIPFLAVTFILATELTHQNLVKAYSDLLIDILPSEGEPATAAAAAAAGEDPPHPDNSPEAKQERHARAANLSARIIHTLESSSHGGLATIGFLLAVYTSFNLMNQIVRTLLFIFDDPRKAEEWNWHVVIKTIVLFFIWMFLLMIFALASVFTPMAVIESTLNDLHLNPILWTKPLLLGRDLFGIFFLFGAFFLTFLLVPSKRYRLSQVRNGSLVASFGWVLCSLIFSYVLPHVWQTNAVYEALGSVVIILIWAQACAWSVIIGACWMVRFPVASRRK